MSILQAGDMYHTGIVVEDFDLAMGHLSDMVGYRWMDPMEVPLPVWTPDGEATVTICMVYSIDEPRLELIRQVPGTTWMPAAGNGIHHIAYYVDDLSVASDALIGEGLPIEICGALEHQHPTNFAYHKGSNGLRIELVPRAMKEIFDAMAQAGSAGA